MRRTVGLLALGLAGAPGCASPGSGVPVEAPPVAGLVLADMDGASHEVDAVIAEGRNVVLVFWSTW